MTQNPPLSLPDSESVGIGNEPRSSLLSFLTGDEGDVPWDDSREESERLKIAKKESILKRYKIYLNVVIVGIL